MDMLRYDGDTYQGVIKGVIPRTDTYKVINTDPLDSNIHTTPSGTMHRYYGRHYDRVSANYLVVVVFVYFMISRSASYLDLWSFPIDQRGIDLMSLST